MSVIDTLTQLKTNTNALYYHKGIEKLGTDQLGKDDFLRMLITKLQNQDPMNPQSEDFMQQVAALGTVESLKNIEKAFQGNTLLTQASTMVGKNVDVIDENGQPVSGYVESVSFDNGTAAISINGQLYSLDGVVKIYSPDQQPGAGS
ncbi:MAG: flagellar hook assembly protein FlgD [Cyanobacteria bacterium HKST-UBA04]|nr:flagellar hook assembly protein FlgD [Cyanobacteria bacterium HKST-UBA04]MCA9841481.1 flagellar hook assembly protein FlgD [Cyanobacteria bacterium HKST-UBA03]